MKANFLIQYFVPVHADHFAAALAGHQQHFQNQADLRRHGRLIEPVPERLDLGRGQVAVARPAAIQFLMSGFGGRADVLAYPSECLLVARSRRLAEAPTAWIVRYASASD